MSHLQSLLDCDYEKNYFLARCVLDFLTLKNLKELTKISRWMSTKTMDIQYIYCFPSYSPKWIESRIHRLWYVTSRDKDQKLLSQYPKLEILRLVICKGDPIPDMTPHKNLKRLKITWSNTLFFQNIKFPPNLQTLILNHSFNDDIHQDFLPTSLKTLKFTKESSFNYPLHLQSLPSHLTTLILGDEFNQPLEVGIFPPTLTKLKFGDLFDQPIHLNVLPKSLLYLKFGLYFDNTFSFPGGLQTLRLCCNKPIPYLSSPALTRLEIESFPYSSNGIALRNITELHLRMRSEKAQNKYPLNFASCFVLRTLTLPSWQSDLVEKLPLSLRTFIVFIARQGEYSPFCTKKEVLNIGLEQIVFRFGRNYREKDMMPVCVDDKHFYTHLHEAWTTNKNVQLIWSENSSQRKRKEI